MSAWYRILYGLGVTPWEEDPERGLVAEQVAGLFDREENDRERPYGRALDLGCGSGVWSVALAARGWRVTGVDIVPKAIRKAQERARASDVEARFVVGDVTALHAARVGSGFDLVVDFECFNHLNENQREAVGREVTAVAAPGATMLMLVWSPGRRGPLPPGASRADIETAFPGWEVIGVDAYAAQSALPWWLRNVDLRFYRIRYAPSLREAERDGAPGARIA